MRKKYTLLLLLSFGLYLTAYGCAALVAGGAAAGGTYAYTEGWVERDYQIGLDRAYDTTLQAAQRMDMAVVEREKDVASANIKARLSETDYRFRLNEKGEGLTNISIRAGIVGDKKASEKIHNQIQTLLAGSGTAAPLARAETQREAPRAQARTTEPRPRTQALAPETQRPREPARVEPETRPEPAQTGPTETTQPAETAMQLRYSAVDVDDAQNWVGQTLVGQKGEELGTVHSLYSPEGDKVLYVIVEGEGGRLHPVPSHMIQTSGQNDRLTAQIDKELFDDAPSFSETERPQLEGERWSEEIRTYYEKKM